MNFLGSAAVLGGKFLENLSVLRPLQETLTLQSGGTSKEHTTTSDPFKPTGPDTVLRNPPHYTVEAEAGTRPPANSEPR
jgi:hypothetical protein